MLMLSHPEIAFRDCEHCKKWWYDEKTGEIHKKNGRELPRPTPPPCESNVGCPKGHWKNQKTLNDRNIMAYQHYRECRAVSSFPDDGVVRYNASIIRDIEDAVDRTDGQRTIAQVAGISMLGGKK
jgi:hypothetical protein